MLQILRGQSVGHTYTFWPHIAKILLIFGHALILDAILATRGQNLYAFWPYLNFGHPCIFATYILILATHAQTLATLAPFWQSLQGLPE